MKIGWYIKVAALLGTKTWQECEEGEK